MDVNTWTVIRIGEKVINDQMLKKLIMLVMNTMILTEEENVNRGERVVHGHDGDRENNG